MKNCIAQQDANYSDATYFKIVLEDVFTNEYDILELISLLKRKNIEDHLGRIFSCVHLKARGGEQEKQLRTLVFNLWRDDYVSAISNLYAFFEEFEPSKKVDFIKRINILFSEKKILLP
jgi:translation elongation factor EF-4